MNKRICHISTVHSAFDIRIFFKECTTLANNGYDVNLVINHDKEETVNGVHIIPLPRKESRAYRFLFKGWSALKKALETKADLYHFHDPELIPFGIVLRLLGKKVIYDVHEDNPKAILSREWIKPGLRKLISTTFDRFERFSVPFLSKIVTARPDIAERFPEKKTVVVNNFPVLKVIDGVEAADEKKNSPVVIYAGGLTKIRGIKEMVEAAGILNGKIELWILGGFDNPSYKEECEGVEGWKYTKYFGHKPQEEAYSYMKKADIGIVNFWPVPNHVRTLPNKPFEYMTCSLPMVMSDFEYWHGIFGECSVFADPNKPEDIAKKIEYLLENKDVAKRLGDKGRSFVEANQSWEAEEVKLLDLYRNLLK
jgi:glycosyltransferase involved in cell wall biosynthesis